MDVGEVGHALTCEQMLDLSILLGFFLDFCEANEVTHAKALCLVHLDTTFIPEYSVNYARDICRQLPKSARVCIS